MNVPTLIVLLLVLLLAVAALCAIRRSRKAPGCRSGCAGCSCRDLCGKE